VDDHLRWSVLHLFSTELNRHPHCGVIFNGVYREGCLYKYSLSSFFLCEFHLIFYNEINECFRNIIIELLVGPISKFCCGAELEELGAY
jgi:hypothetical protein